MFENYIKISFRNLTRYKINTIINVLGITLGVSGAIVIYTIIGNEISFDNFHSKATNTYRVVQHNKTADGTQFWNTTAYPLAGALKAEFANIEVTQTAGPMSLVLSGEGKSKEKFEENKVLFVDENFLNVFDFQKAFPEDDLWIAGNPNSAFEHPNSVVLTETTANRYFGNNSTSHNGIIGKTLSVNEDDLLTITGIIKDPPQNISLLFELLIPYEYFKLKNEFMANNWSGNYQGTTFLVLPDQQDVTEVESKIASLKTIYLKPEDDKRINYKLQPLKQVHVDTLYGSSPGSYVMNKSILNAMVLLAVFLLVIGCVNYINLATAQSLKRSKEVGVRKVLGSTKKQLFFQYMSEAFIIVLIAFAIAVYISRWAIQQINGLISFVKYNYLFDIQFLVMGISLVALITLIAGFYPALVLSKFSPVLALKNNIGLKKNRGLSLRQLLIVFQFTIAQLLIAGTVIVASQMNFFNTKDLGYNKDNVLTLNIPDSNPEKMEAFRERLLRYPQIEKVSFSSGPPTAFERQYGTTFRLSHETLEMRREAEFKILDPEYIDIYNLQLIAGKWIGEENKTENFNGFVVNEALLKMLDLNPEESIGVKIAINEGEALIVGVVQDFHNNSLQENLSPCVFFYWGTGFLDQASVLLSNNLEREQNLASMEIIKKSWKEVYQDEIYKSEFLADKLQQNYILENLIFKASQIASAIAIFIACLGLYGLTSLVALQRKKEMGIRKVLGASIHHLLQLLSWDFIKLILMAILIATPFIWYFMDQWLLEFAHRIKLEWWYFVGAGSLIIIISLITISFQSLKVALINPVDSLRSE